MFIIPKIHYKTDFTLFLLEYPELNMKLPWPAQGNIILHVPLCWRSISIGSVFDRFIQRNMVEDIATQVLNFRGKCVPIYTAS